MPIMLLSSLHPLYINNAFLHAFVELVSVYMKQVYSSQHSITWPDNARGKWIREAF